MAKHSSEDCYGERIVTSWTEGDAVAEFHRETATDYSADAVRVVDLHAVRADDLHAVRVIDLHEAMAFDFHAA